MRNLRGSILLVGFLLFGVLASPARAASIVFTGQQNQGYNGGSQRYLYTYDYAYQYTGGNAAAYYSENPAAPPPSGYGVNVEFQGVAYGPNGNIYGNRSPPTNWRSWEEGHGVA